MVERKAIYKAKEVDIKATVVQLEANDTVYLPYDPQLRINAIRTAVSRLNHAGEPKYSVKETVNGSIITRVV